MEQRLYIHQPVQTNRIVLRSSDPPLVRYCKELANNILLYNFADSTAWRVDFSDVFEKYIQHIFKTSAKETGAKLLQNFKFHSIAPNPYSWTLKHVEPDAIYYKNKYLIFIDAKYKSNLYNKFELSEKLKEDHRHDVHQILSYCSFSSTALKYGFLCYPSSTLEVSKIRYQNGLNEVTNTIVVLGVPLKKDVMNDAKKLLIGILAEIQKGWPRIPGTLPSGSAEFEFRHA